MLNYKLPQNSHEFILIALNTRPLIRLLVGKVETGMTS